MTTNILFLARVINRSRYWTFTLSSKFIIFIHLSKVNFFPRKVFYNYLDQIYSVAVTSDSKFIVCGSEKSVKVYDIHTQQQIHNFSEVHISNLLSNIKRLNHELDKVSSVFITSDNRFVVSGSSDHSIKVFDLLTKQQVHHLPDAHQGKFLFNNKKFI